MVEFLSSIMPLKRVDELYTAIGFNKHGKTELYRSLMQDLERPEARFAFAEGDEGMVMAVFTLPVLQRRSSRSSRTASARRRTPPARR